MAKTKKAEVAASKTAQDVQETQGMFQDTRGQEMASEAAQEPPVGPQEIIGPENPEELLGCQDADEAELVEGLFLTYAVTAAGGLRIRAELSLDAPVAAVLPCGAGVFGDGEPGPDGWVHVFTGRLSGWMLGRHLEPLLFPEWPSLDTEGKLPYVID